MFFRQLMHVVEAEILGFQHAFGYSLGRHLVKHTLMESLLFVCFRYGMGDSTFRSNYPCPMLPRVALCKSLACLAKHCDFCSFVIFIFIEHSFLISLSYIHIKEKNYSFLKHLLIKTAFVCILEGLTASYLGFILFVNLTNALVQKNYVMHTVRF